MLYDDNFSFNVRFFAHVESIQEHPNRVNYLVAFAVSNAGIVTSNI
jgi:hypothetical protein